MPTVKNVETGHHEGLSSFVSRNQSFLVDRGRNAVAGLKHGQGGDVTGGAVRVVSKHRHLLRGTGAFQKGGRWKQFDSIGLCNILGVLRSTVSQPTNQGLPMFAVLLEQFSTGVRDRFDGFFDKQTFLRNSQVNARVPSSRVILKWSPFGSYPNKESMKRSCPRADPWQDPVLQPAFMNTGMTSRLKLIGLSVEAPRTSTGMILV